MGYEFRVCLNNLRLLKVRYVGFSSVAVGRNGACTLRSNANGVRKEVCISEYLSVIANPCVYLFIYLASLERAPCIHVGSRSASPLGFFWRFWLVSMGLEGGDRKTDTEEEI